MVFALRLRPAGLRLGGGQPAGKVSGQLFGGAGAGRIPCRAERRRPFQPTRASRGAPPGGP
eukprot:7475135-Lingulodinium_polyedra.AAC.1